MPYRQDDIGMTRLDDCLPAAFDVVRRVLAGPESGTGPLAEVLHSALYRDWYCAVGEKPQVHHGPRDLAELLRAAHACSTRWQDGWRVERASAQGRLAVSRGAETRVVHVIDCLPMSGCGGDIRPGDTIRVVERRCSESLNPGDWVSFDAGWHARKEPLLRVYWNVTPDGAPRIVASLTEAFGEGGAYFLKAPRQPAEYDRRDAMVLYLPRERFAATAPAILAAIAAAGTALADPVPPLTLRLALGVGLAEDPGAAGESFGTYRCGLIARALAAAIARGAMQQQVWREGVLAAFEDAGIPHQRPWAATMSSTEYRLP
jgi:hypothetical protein